MSVTLGLNFHTRSKRIITMETEKPTLQLIGLDGATFELIKPWAESGELPTFAMLLEQGVHGVLRSPIPQSPPAWASFMTGMNPGKHGIYDFSQPKEDSYELELTSGGTCKQENLWAYLSRHGRTVGVINVPMTYPPNPVNGFLISGFDTPYGNTDFAYPLKLFEELQSLVGDYTFFPIIAGVPLKEVISNFHNTIVQRRTVMKHLIDKHSPDFFMMVFNATDTLQHLCLPSHGEANLSSEQMRGLLSVYKHLDEFLSDLISELPEGGSLIVLSDHGGGPLQSYINLDHWLAMQGWLRYATEDSKLALRRQVGVRFRAIVDIAKKLVPYSLKRSLKRIKRVNRAIDAVTEIPRLDWSKTMAYTCSSQGIYINVQGKRPQGIVEPGTPYDDLRAEITSALMDLKDPVTDERVVERVYCKEEIFQGAHLEAAPDLYIHWKDDEYLSWSDDTLDYDQIFRRPVHLEFEEIVPDNTKAVSVGCHRQQGIFILYGNAANSSHIVEEAE